VAHVEAGERDVTAAERQQRLARSEQLARRVSCVPGSPIDCAAMIPTASPISHIPPVARKIP
jgi:hypothetical protein